MKKYFLIGILAMVISGTLIWHVEHKRYEIYVASSPLTGTILTWKTDEKSVRRNLILLNPNNPNDCVEFEFYLINKYHGIGHISSVFFDGEGFYIISHEDEELNPTKSGQLNLSYLSSDGIVKLAENLICNNWAFSGFVKSDTTLFMKLENNLYEIDTDTKSLHNVKKFRDGKVQVYSYNEGIVYQNNKEVRFYTKGDDRILFYIPDRMSFDGWYEMGKSVLLETPDRTTYIMNIIDSELQLFSEFSFVNYGNSSHGILLQLMPKGGGGATIFDTDYTWSFLLGNDVFTAFVISIYNTNTGYIKNLYYPYSDTTSSWLDIPYDKERFTRIRQEITEMANARKM